MSDRWYGGGVSPWTRGAGRRLLDAVRVLAAERPIHQISVAALCHRAGLTRDTFYRYAARPVDVLARAMDDDLPSAEALLALIAHPRRPTHWKRPDGRYLNTPTATRRSTNMPYTRTSTRLCARFSSAAWRPCCWDTYRPTPNRYPPSVTPRRVRPKPGGWPSSPQRALSAPSKTGWPRSGQSPSTARSPCCSVLRRRGGVDGVAAPPRARIPMIGHPGRGSPRFDWALAARQTWTNKTPG